MAVEVPVELAIAGAFPALLEHIKRLLEDRIRSDLDLAGVKVWQWHSQTGGRAHTEAGERMGLELRGLGPVSAGASQRREGGHVTPPPVGRPQ
jgi:hypothetical protein